ncbi:hypothetical protein EPN87_00855 [archaeon]|nr:MAG: hypothetical protein EPN87_00855 [archaeon]
MKIKLSATFEGKCSICNSDTMVFRAGDEETKKVVTVCKDCSEKLKGKSLEQVVEEYGKLDSEPFKPGVRFEPGTKPN